MRWRKIRITIAVVWSLYVLLGFSYYFARSFWRDHGALVRQGIEWIRHEDPALR